MRVLLGAVSFLVALTAFAALQPTDGPGARYGHELVYDEARHVTLLFGGFGPDGEPKSDTWAWDGSAWIELDVDGPGARGFQAMTYDPDGERILLFGGRDGDRLFNDLWSWDGRRWDRIGNGGPIRRGVYASAYDRSRGALVIHGSGDRVDGRWELESSSWLWRESSGWRVRR